MYCMSLQRHCDPFQVLGAYVVVKDREYQRVFDDCLLDLSKVNPDVSFLDLLHSTKLELRSIKSMIQYHSFYCFISRNIICTSTCVRTS